MSDGSKGGVQGEGNYEAAREYDQQVTEHARDEERVREEAEAARDALDGPEGEELEEAEAEGRAKARD